MPQFKIEDYFILKSVTPSSLVPDNIIQFSYKSTAVTHDHKPIVLVHEKQSDRIYGINLNYDMKELNEAITNIENLILPHLEKKYFIKYPENKQKLNETHQKFNKTLITEEEYHEFMKSFDRSKLKKFQVKNKNMDACRQYRYDRMTAVSIFEFKT